MKVFIAFLLLASPAVAHAQTALDVQVAIAIANANAETTHPVVTPPSTPIDPATLPADSQPTPWPAVGAMLNALAPKPDEVLLDPGCGYDARLLIQACRYFGTEKAIGVEIDPALAESARRNVELAGLSDRIEIRTGDSTKLDIQADVGVAYMWPEVLAKLKPRIERLDRFVCFGFDVPGLPMTTTTLAGGGKVYSWKRDPAVTRVPITKTVSSIDRLPRGSYCQICGRHCSNPMQHVRQQQIVGYETKPIAPAKPSVQTVLPSLSNTESNNSNCPNGNCSNTKMGGGFKLFRRNR